MDGFCCEECVVLVIIDSDASERSRFEEININLICIYPCAERLTDLICSYGKYFLLAPASL